MPHKRRGLIISRNRASRVTPNLLSAYLPSPNRGAPAQKRVCACCIIEAPMRRTRHGDYTRSKSSVGASHAPRHQEAHTCRNFPLELEITPSEVQKVSCRARDNVDSSIELGIMQKVSCKVGDKLCRRRKNAPRVLIGASCAGEAPMLLFDVV
jgi:hypothetical protein